MERRKHPRIQLPLLVELKHPALGKQTCIARDISEGGVFVQIPGSALKPGAKVKLTLKNPSTIDTQPTPTVDMEVRRVEPDGIGCAFTNRTGRHLWESVERMRSELAVGRDYFQLHAAAAVFNGRNRLLVVQQNGRWTFPGTYLTVGDQWRAALALMLDERFSLHAEPASLSLLALETEARTDLPEAAVARAFAVTQLDASGFAFEPGERYKASRWLQNPRMIDELTFADELTRSLARDAFGWLDRQGRTP